MRTLKFSSLLLLLASVLFAQDVPDAYRLSGHFKATSGDHNGDNVDIYFTTTTEYQVRIGDRWFRVTRASEDEATMSGREYAGPSAGLTGAITGTPANTDPIGNATLSITVEDVRNFEAKLEDGANSDEFKLDRRILIPPANPDAYDRGPRGNVARHLREAPNYPNEGAYENVFWDDWGPVFYRGRLNGKARVIGIASDPGPTESLPFIRRSLVGDAGQRTQGFLEKIGLTESYVLVNAFTYPTRPSRVEQGRKVMNDYPEQLEWRNTFYDLLYDKGGVQGIVVLGRQARIAFDAWNRSRMDRGLEDLSKEVTVVYGAHPSSGRDEWGKRTLAREWRNAVEELRKVVTPDDPELAKQPNFGAEFSEIDYAEIPPKDLPGASRNYPWVRDNSWSRTKVKGRRNNAVRRHGRLNMEFNHMDGTTDFFRAVGRDLSNPNATPSFKTFNATADDPLAGYRALTGFVIAERFGADSVYARLAPGLPNKTRILNALKEADATWRSDDQVKEKLDHLFRDVPGFTPQAAGNQPLGGN